MTKVLAWLAVALALAIIIALATFHVTSPASAEPSAEVIQMRTQMLDPSVKLGDGCSGQIIYSKRGQETGDVTTLILTAKHCVSDTKTGGTVDVRLPTYDDMGRLMSERVFVALIEAQDFSADVALLKLRDADTFFTTTVKIAPEKVVLYEGEPTWAVGYPLAWSRTITPGMMSTGQRIAIGSMAERDYIRSTPAIAPGSSGGGLYRKNDKGDYELIGTTTAAPMPYFFMGLWTPIADTHVFLKRAAPVAYKEMFPDEAEK